MISESQMRYGSLVLRHGSSRWNWRNQPSSCFRSETFVIGNHRRDARLLQHDFREPDAVRVSRFAPRQFALELAEPAEQLFQIGNVRNRESPPRRASAAT